MFEAIANNIDPLLFTSTLTFFANLDEIANGPEVENIELLRLRCSFGLSNPAAHRFVLRF